MSLLFCWRYWNTFLRLQNTCAQQKPYSKPTRSLAPRRYDSSAPKVFRGLLSGEKQCVFCKTYTSTHAFQVNAVTAWHSLVSVLAQCMCCQGKNYKTAKVIFQTSSDSGPTQWAVHREECQCLLWHCRLFREYALLGQTAFRVRPSRRHKIVCTSSWICKFSAVRTDGVSDRTILWFFVPLSSRCVASHWIYHAGPSAFSNVVLKT